MTKYAVSIYKDGDWEGIALFSDKVNMQSIIDFCNNQFEADNLLGIAADDTTITDLTTGEIIWSWYDEQDGVYYIGYEDEDK